MHNTIPFPFSHSITHVHEIGMNAYLFYRLLYNMTHTHTHTTVTITITNTATIENLILYFVALYFGKYIFDTYFRCVLSTNFHASESIGNSQASE